MVIPQLAFLSCLCIFVHPRWGSSVYVFICRSITCVVTLRRKQNRSLIAFSMSATSHRGEGALGPQNVAAEIPVPADIVEEDIIEFDDVAINPTEIITATAAAQSNADFIQLQLQSDAARMSVPMSLPIR